MRLEPPPSAAATPAEIVAWEESRGTDDWTGAQGNTDAWQLHVDFWNHDTYGLMSTMNTVSAELGKLG